MSGSTTSAAVLTDSVDSLLSSRLYGSIYDSSSKRGASQISRSYKQASKFFLQRRFPEALLTIQPLITKQKDNGYSSPDRAAPVASASRTNRVKVWNLYLTLLNSIVELGADDGKNLFGNTPWKAMVAKVRDGSIWEEVVQTGYMGVEGSVDADVVSNL